MSFVLFLRSCGVVCDGNYSLKNAQGSGRGSFAEGCPSRKVAEGDVGKIQRIEYYPDVAQFPCPVLEFDFDILRYVGLFCFGVSRKPRGSFAEAPRKEHMPKQRYSLPMPSQSPSPRQTNVASKRKRPKRKQMKAQQAKMKGTETDHNQKPWKRSGAVVAEAKTKKTRSQKLAEGLYVKCASRKLALWSREALRKLLRKRWIISFPPQRKKEQNSNGGI